MLEKCDARSLPIPDESIQCVVTSPPYWGLRDYGVAGQFGLEKTPGEYIQVMVETFREIKRVLRDDGTLWLNIGDTYNQNWRGGGVGTATEKQISNRGTPAFMAKKPPEKIPGIKSKDLVGIPWMLAFALRADGWYLRQDIIWSKPNPMPESVRDRCTRSHEYIFLLSKSQRYYYDGDAICEPCKPATIARISQQNLPNQHGSDRVPGKTNGPMKACFGGRLKSRAAKEQSRLHSGNEDNGNYLERGANKRSVWWITTKPYKGAHFATFPEDIPRLCILAGSRPDDFILDPFCGSGTTGKVAVELGRHFIGTDIAYQDLAEARIRSTGIDP